MCRRTICCKLGGWSRCRRLLCVEREVILPISTCRARWHVLLTNRQPSARATRDHTAAVAQLLPRFVNHRGAGACATHQQNAASDISQQSFRILVCRMQMASKRHPWNSNVSILSPYITIHPAWLDSALSDSAPYLIAHYQTAR